MRRLRAAAATWGAEVQDDSSGGWRVYWLVAPPGTVWACDTLHRLVVQWDSPETKVDAIRDAIERLGFGLKPCDEADCEQCGRRYAGPVGADGLPVAPEPCSPGCRGWEIFDAFGGRHSGLQIQRCDDCWRGVIDAPEDADYGRQEVCLAALRAAQAEYEERASGACAIAAQHGAAGTEPAAPPKEGS
jgi:hypothetical protein